MKQSVLTKDHISFLNKLEGNVLCIYKKNTLELPNKDFKFVEFGDLSNPKYMLGDWGEWTMVVLGMSYINTPSNRCDSRFEFIYNWSTFKNVYVIDDKPYIIDKWRIWFLFGATTENALNVDHSYAIESRYNNYLEGISEDPLSIDKLMELDLFIDYKYYFDFEIKFETIKMSADVHNQYEELKRKVFDNWKGPSNAIMILHRFCQNVLQDHNMSRNLKSIYELKDDHTFYITDLPVDLYLRGEYKRIYRETNEITSAYYEKIHR